MAILCYNICANGGVVVHDYVEILKGQKKELARLMANSALIERREVTRIDLDSTMAQIVIGVRRCGKSVLCRMALAKSGLTFGYIDFDDENLANLKASDLNKVLEAAYEVYGPFEHLFLDEVQDVPSWQLFVNRLLRQGMHLVITGSNSRLLSSELATHLTGRFMSVELMPFTFAEFRRYLGRGEVELAEGRAEARRDFDVYFENGGFPETFSVLDRKTYFKLLYDSILFRDILRRHKVRNPALLMNVSYVMMSNFACEVSALKLARQLGVKGVHTVQNYIHYLEEGYMIETLPLYGRKAWERTRMGKSYAIDVGFANYFTGLLAGDERMGRCLENIVFLQLRNRRSDLDFDIFFWKDANGEIDFLCERRGRVMKLIQVAYDISAEKTRKRELSTLFAAGKKFKCDDLVLVTDRVNEVVKEGRQMVRIVDVVTWLLETDKEQIRDDLFARAKGSAVEVKRMRNQNREQGIGNRE